MRVRVGVRARLEGHADLQEGEEGGGEEHPVVGGVRAADVAAGPHRGEVGPELGEHEVWEPDAAYGEEGEGEGGAAELVDGAAQLALGQVGQLPEEVDHEERH